MTTIGSNIIETSNLTFDYKNFRALSNINLQVPVGSIFGFLGPNGAGKSTTIKTLLGLLPTAPGMIKMFGKQLNTNKMFILERTGAMVESPSLYEHLDAVENMQITARMRGLSFSRIGPLLEMVSLTVDANRKVKQYSTGMKQRLCLALALLPKPELLILDEPINGLDPTGILEMRHMLAEINTSQNCTILLSSHILSEVEKICTHAAVIHHGKLLFQGRMSELLSDNQGVINIEIQVGQPEKALKCLKPEYSPEKEVDKIKLRVTQKEEIAFIIQQLVNEGVDIYSVENTCNSLESNFLNLLSIK